MVKHYKITQNRNLRNIAKKTKKRKLKKTYKKLRRNYKNQSIKNSGGFGEGDDFPHEEKEKIVNSILGKYEHKKN